MALLPLASLADRPELTVAVVSDVHTRPADSRHFYENRFRRALKFFDKMKVDAVVGDWIEFSWHEWFRKVGEYWFEVFTQNRRSDGRALEWGVISFGLMSRFGHLHHTTDCGAFIFRAAPPRGRSFFLSFALLFRSLSFFLFASIFHLETFPFQFDSLDCTTFPFSVDARR